MRARVSAAVVAGIGMILFGAAVFGWIEYWMATRTFVAFNQPVSLAPGHIRTGPFQINLNDRFTISIRSDRDVPKCDGSEVLKSTWNLYLDGQHSGILPEVRAGLYLDGFYSGPGAYDLDIEVLTDASCLNAANPRLRITAYRQDYESRHWTLSWLGGLSMGTGLSLLVIAARRRNRPVLVATRPPARWKKFERKRDPLFALPSFAMMCVPVLTILTFIMMVGRVLEHWIPYGLPVRVLRPGYLAQPTPGLDPIVVRLTLSGQNPRPDVYIGAQLVAWEEFETRLLREIGQRPAEWPVYFEGDPQMDWQWAAQTIDRIHGLPAEVVIIRYR